MKKLFLTIIAVAALTAFMPWQEAYAEKPDGCSLLNNPEIRAGMSNALEMKLMVQCGEISQEELDQRRSEVTGDSSIKPLGADIPVSNPAMDTGGTTQSESSIVVVGNVVCAAWNDSGEGYGANGFSGFASSGNGGLTFTDHGPFPTGTGSDKNWGDPSLAYSVRDSAFYYAALSDQGLSLWKSTNSCQSFSYVGPIHVGSGDDKELMAVDNNPSSPYYGRIYVGWTNFSLGANRNQTTYSNNGGASWSAAVSLPSSGVNGQGMWPAVAPNGDVYFAVLNRASSIGGLQDQWVYKSTNGGVSWTKMTNIGTGQLRPENAASSSACGRQALNADIRNLSSPQIAIHADAAAPAGYVVHAIYPYDSDGAGADQSNVFYRRSTDGAVSWSAEVKLNDDGTSRDQWFPAIAVNSNGAVAASWYDRRLDTGNVNFDRYAAISMDGGLTWSSNVRISDVSSPVSTNRPHFDGLATCYHGDYDQVVVDANKVHILWSDDRRITATGPNPDMYYDQLTLGVIVPDVWGNINLQGSPVAGSKVILKQTGELNQTIKTDSGGEYKFNSVVPGKKFKIIINGPVVP
ncbi:MAG: exo-alpha-sialidase [Nitrospiraceae bacterium]|nr:MAG: exo-alpha-sialidase [Nitrospiraceae bacterium]